MTRRSTRRAALAALAAMAFAAAGCGDDGPTDREFLAEANAICKRHHDNISAAAARLLGGGRLPSGREFGRLARETIIPQYAAQIRELRKVEAPETKTDLFDSWLDDSEALRARLERNPRLIQMPSSLNAVNVKSDRLGLSNDCNIGPG